MPSTLIDKDGKEHVVDLFDLFPPREGSMNQYYGRIGEGKTYAATADAIEDLEMGQVVYTSWHLNWDGYDERKKWWARLLYKIGIKKYFWIHPKENWHYFNMAADNALEVLGKINDCIVYLDEGHLLLDSYLGTKMRSEDRHTVLATRHFNRTINVISQRPTAVHVTVRANVNRFYKLEKIMDWSVLRWRIVRFMRTEFQDTGADDKPDEQLDADGKYAKAVDTKHYFSRRRIREAYDTKYLRMGAARSQPLNSRRVDLNGDDIPFSPDEIDILVGSDIVETT